MLRLVKTCFHLVTIHVDFWSLSHVWLMATPGTAVCQASLFFTLPRNLLKLISIELVMPSSHLILCHPLLLLPSIFPSIRVFSIELALCIRWPEYWSFSISLSNECSGLISFRIDRFAALAVQGLSRVFSSTTSPKHQFFHKREIVRRKCCLTGWTFSKKTEEIIRSDWALNSNI